MVIDFADLSKRWNFVEVFIFFSLLFWNVDYGFNPGLEMLLMT